MNTEKLVHQLFIGKVADILGIDKTTELLKEAKTAIEPLTEGQKLPISGVVGSEERTELFCGVCGLGGFKTEADLDIHLEDCDT